MISLRNIAFVAIIGSMTAASSTGLQLPRMKPTFVFAGLTFLINIAHILGHSKTKITTLVNRCRNLEGLSFGDPCVSIKI